jgi:hypothetical protein
MLVKDLKVGAMYHSPGYFFFKANSYAYIYPNTTVEIPRWVNLIADKFVYLGTKKAMFVDAFSLRRPANRTLRLCLIGDKVLPMAPDAWKYIEPLEKE